MRKVTIYSTEHCPYCRMAKAFLQKNGVPFESIDVGRDEVQARKMIELSGQRGVPVITIDDEVIVGFDVQRLNELFGMETEGDLYDVIIVGAGPAGLTAAVYCARKLLKTMVISENIGGQALSSWSIDNYMGYRMITGEDLMKKFEEQVRELHVNLELDRIDSISRDGTNFVFDTATGRKFTSKTVIFAQGNKPRLLGLPEEHNLIGKGVSLCSTCDGPLYKGKRVAVVGGGNSAVQAAIEMSKIAHTVSLIARSTVKADGIYADLLKRKDNIVLHEGTQVKALQGEKSLEGATILKTATGEEQRIPLDGLFIEIGWLPNTEFLQGFVALNDKGEIAIDVDCHTSVPGVFAAGDVSSVRGKQIIIAAGEGAKAALEAHEYVMRLEE